MSQDDTDSSPLSGSRFYLRLLIATVVIIGGIVIVVHFSANK